MKLYAFSLIVLFLLISLSGISQLKSKVFLNNGSTYVGRITEQDSVHLKLEISGEHELMFLQSEVEKVEQLSMFRPEKGIFVQLEPIVYIDDEVSAIVHGKVGFDFNRHWSLSLGSGIEQHINHYFFPVFLEGKVHFFDHYITPYVTSQFGYHISSTSNPMVSFSGYFVSSHLNVVCFTNDHLGISLSAGVRFNEVRREVIAGPNLGTEFKDNFTRFEFKLGLLLK